MKKWLITWLLCMLPFCAMAEELTSWVVPENYEELTGDPKEWFFFEDSVLNQMPYLKEITLPASMDEETVMQFMYETRELYSMLWYASDYGMYTPEREAIPEYYAPGYALTHVHIAPEHQTLCSIDGVVFSKDQKTLVAFAPGRTGSYTVPDGVEVIGEGAFAYCDGLYKIGLPVSLKTIEERAFYCCGGLVSINIPAGVERIGKRAFFNCISLQSLSLPDGVAVEDRALCYLFSLKNLFVGKGVWLYEDGLKYTHPNAVVYCPQGSAASHEAAIAQLKQAPLGGDPKLVKSPNVIYENPAIVTKEQEDVEEGASVNILWVQGDLATVWVAGEETVVPVENLALCDPYGGFERILEIRGCDPLYTLPDQSADSITPVSEYYLPVLQRFGDWYVVQYEWNTYFVPVYDGQPAANEVISNLKVLLEPMILCDIDGNSIQTFYPGEQLVQDGDLIHIGGLEGYAPQVQAVSVRDESFAEGF